MTRSRAARGVAVVAAVLLPGSIVARGETAGESVLKELRELEAGAFATATSNWTRAEDPLAATFSAAAKADEAKAGVVVYNRPWIVYTTPRSAPSEAERAAAFTCRAAPGELEPISVGVYCLSDASSIRGSISDLKGPGTIPASSATVYSVYQVPMPWIWQPSVKSARRARTWDRVPNLMLDVPGGLSGRATESRQLIFDLAVPADARAGIYKGQITIATDKGRVVRDVRVTVLPFGLHQAHKQWRRGMFGVPRNDADARFQVRWGLNSFAPWWHNAHVLFGTTHGLCNAGGDMLLVKEGREAKMLGPVLDRARRAGFKGWVYFLMDRGFGNAVQGWWGCKNYPSEEYQAAYKKTVKALLKTVKDAGSPEPILVANDEPTSREYDTERIFKEMKWIDEVGGRNYAVVFRKTDPQRFAGKPYFQMWVSNNPSPAKLAAARESGCRLATYRGGHWQRKIAEVRFHFGCKSFWFDAPLTFSWAHDWDYGAGSGPNRLNDFAGGREGGRHTSIFFDAQGRPVPTLSMLAIREAIDDRLYLETLRKTGRGAEFIKRMKAHILERFTPAGPHRYQDLSASADPWTYCQAVQTVDKHRPVFMDRWREAVISELLRRQAGGKGGSAPRVLGE